MTLDDDLAALPVEEIADGLRKLHKEGMLPITIDQLEQQATSPAGVVTRLTLRAAHLLQDSGVDPLTSLQNDVQRLRLAAERKGIE